MGGSKNYLHAKLGAFKYFLTFIDNKSINKGFYIYIDTHTHNIDGINSIVILNMEIILVIFNSIGYT